jgi:hypothetical protein
MNATKLVLHVSFFLRNVRRKSDLVMSVNKRNRDVILTCRLNGNIFYYVQNLRTETDTLFGVVIMKRLLKEA